MRQTSITPECVEFVPEVLDEGVLYISQTYGTAVHKCCCGCGQKIITPLNRTGWQLTVEASCVSLYPSIGNWSFPCQSHYWIKRNAVHWSYQMSKQQIEAGRRRDAKLKERYFGTHAAPADSYEPSQPGGAEANDPTLSAPGEGIWQTLRRWLLG